MRNAPLPPNDLLPFELHGLWNDWLLAEERHPRSKMNSCLDAFVSRLLEIPLEHWRDWALSIAREHVEVGPRIEIRMPLFRSVLFPVLRRAISNRVPGAAKWLAGLSEQLYRAADCLSQLPPEQQTEIGLLLTAIEHDPSDDQARRRLIHAMAWQLENSIHEIPAGVLYGHDGATIEQCRELQSQLDLFCQLIQSADLGDRYQWLMDACQFHFSNYPMYLANRGLYPSYVSYLHAVESK